MSVDLVGSTAFKAKQGERREENEPYPIWLNRTKSFYRQFPQIMNSHFRECLSGVEGSHSFSDETPKVWKTVGDEIIFCIRIYCLEHLACCVRAFRKALSTYGNLINEQERELDVKGCAWIASFPAPNATVVSATRFALEDVGIEVGNQLDEEDESKADKSPGEYDFLGKQIDTGFRISRFAQSHELSVSIDLGWLLTLLRQRDLVDFQFTFRGRESLKGVIGGIPYPIVTAQTERSVERRELDALERTVTGASFAEPVNLRNYLYSFMNMHSLEVPVVAAFRESYDDDALPKCYKDLVVAWEASEKEQSEREKAIEASENDKQIGQSAATNVYPITPPTFDPKDMGEINSLVDNMVKNYWSKGEFKP